MIMRMTWRWWHDCFVYLLHAALWRIKGQKHEVVLDATYEPPKPMCRTCHR